MQRIAGGGGDLMDSQQDSAKRRRRAGHRPECVLWRGGGVDGRDPANEIRKCGGLGGLHLREDRLDERHRCAIDPDRVHDRDRGLFVELQRIETAVF